VLEELALEPLTLVGGVVVRLFPEPLVVVVVVVVELWEPAEEPCEW
jgi:hypothetical protein